MFGSAFASGTSSLRPTIFDHIPSDYSLVPGVEPPKDGLRSSRQDSREARRRFASGSFLKPRFYPSSPVFCISSGFNHASHSSCGLNLRLKRVQLLSTTSRLAHVDLELLLTRICLRPRTQPVIEPFLRSLLSFAIPYLHYWSILVRTIQRDCLGSSWNFYRLKSCSSR